MLASIMQKVRGPKDEEQQEQGKTEGYNRELLSEIQPQGGIKFNESYIRKGDGYETCVHIYDFQTIVNDFWLEEIMNMPNVIAALDVATPNRREVMSKLNKSMAEQKTRTMQAKETADAIEATESFEELSGIYNEIRQGEVVKRIVLRLYVSSKTLDELEVTVKKVIDDLEALNFRGSVFLNEQEYEWGSLIESFSHQMKYPNKRKGIELPALSLAGGFPFHYTSLDDPFGTHYGTTDTHGNVIFDLFHKDKQRKFYNALMIGKMGSGKSTLLKKMALDNAIKGHKVRILDVTGEFGELAEALDGKTIALDGSDGSINPLQVYRSETTDEGAIKQEASFAKHLSKMQVFYRFISPDVANEEIKEFQNTLRRLYIEQGLWSDSIDPEENNITERRPEEYPIFSDLLTMIQDDLYIDKDKQLVNEDVSVHRRERLENIELNIKNLVETYGRLFNAHSSLMDFDKEDFVAFHLRNLSELSSEVFQAQLFNVLNMLWDGMLGNGQPQLQAFNKHRLRFEDAVRYLILIDEAHHIINTRKGSEHGVTFLQTFMREARKYFGGLFFASHVIEDFVPDKADQSAAEEVKKLFSLTQYKFIGEQDSESLPRLKEIFTGQLNDSELGQIPYLSQGEVVLSISSVKNIKMKVDVSKQELDLFGGGA
ncbi:VirB4 family type IV secretion system protein [Marinococcus halophilus]|uniref:VirB4 family type IV secretion system protein n=1 Tax=Marinococcus halophilus TaxID=1371 RepID=UPI0009A839EB|nr:type IV secretion system protein VirB4 [Marinococcus halophilus]